MRLSKRIALFLILVLGYIATSGFEAFAQRPVLIEQKISSDKKYLELTVKLYHNTLANQGTPAFPWGVGDANFAIELNSDALELDSAFIARSGRFSDVADPTFYQPITIKKTVANYLVLSIRTKIPYTPYQGVPIALRATDSAATLAVVKVKIKDCFQTGNVAWRFNRSRVRGIGNVRFTDLDIENNPLGNLARSIIPSGQFPLRFDIYESFNLACETRPGNIRFNWDPADSVNYYRLFLLDSFTNNVVQVIQIPGNLFTYQWAGPQGATRGAYIRAYGYCPADSGLSNTVTGCQVLPCPVIDTPIVSVPALAACPGKPYRISITNPYRNGRISYNNGQSFSVNFDTTFTALGQLPTTRDTTFTLIQTDSNLCKSQAITLRIIINQLNDLTTQPIIRDKAFYAAPKVFCNNNVIPLGFDISANGDSLPFKWVSNARGRFVDANGNLDTTSKSVFFQADLKDTGIVKFWVFNRCFDKADTITARLVSGNDPKFTVDASSLVGPTSVIAGEEVIFRIDKFAQNIGAVYTWDFGNGKRVAHKGGNTMTHKFPAPGTYRVRMYATSGQCEFDSLIIIKAERMQELFVPNVFSPYSSNAKSKTLKVFGLGISDEDFSFQIYNRWGEVVYSTELFKEANEEGWNGAKNNKGDMLPLGTYTYALVGKYLDGSAFEKSGNITLLK